MNPREILVIGGGPAGAVCAERAARAGLGVTLLDDHLAWEKPCGGGLTHKALRAYPFLLEGPQAKKIVREIELKAGDHPSARMTLGSPLVIYARQTLNGLLLDRAERAGCRVCRARAASLDVSSVRPSIRLTDGTRIESDFIVLAAGARNRMVSAGPGSASLQPLESADFEQTAGYYVPGESDVLKIKFLPEFRGYLWSFPRADHLSVGICGKLDESSTAALRRHLDAYLDEEGLSHQGARFYSHLLPSPRERTLQTRPILGAHWALAGDAAAMVDSITGEGIYYAMRSGELLGESLAAGQPESYPQHLRAEFGSELERAAQLAPRFYRDRFLGGAITTRTIEFARRSPAFRRLLADLFTGAQDYRTLPWRLWKQLPVSLAEIAWSVLVRD